MASDKIKVAVRVRPFNKREESLGTNNIVSMKANQTVLHHPDENETHKPPKSFTFDHCFDSMYPTSSSFANQEDVFDALGKDILSNAFKGYNACIFAYGQTGSGKSYSMMGGQADRGIIPRLCVSLFEKIGEVSSSDSEAKVEVSYMEIYNEKVHDLLDLGQTGGTNKTGLKVREHKVLGPYVDGLSQLAVENYQEIEDLMIEGNKSRTVAATNMNNESSRSHAVFTIILTFTLTDPVSGLTGEKASRMSLVDLAGSERANKTGAMGDRLKEGSNINKSLTTLGLVISKLAEQSQSCKASKQGDKFVPYRDSVLTWLLKDNLGGNSKTVMVATISPSADNYEETLSTLRYADRAKRIATHAVVNEDPNARIIRELRAEVEALKDMLLHAAQPEVLKEKLCENEKLMKEMSLTWEEKLHKTEQKQEDRRHAMEKMGISVQSSGIKVEKNKYFLVNLNADPSMNELLVYYLKDQILVGRSDAKIVQDIQLSGLGIQSEHCVIEINNKELWINPVPGARTCVNGREIVSQTQLKNGDRLLWGSNHFFRVNCPKINAEDSKPGAARTPLTPFDWRMAQEEVMMAESTSAPMKEAMARLEKQHEEEKQTALENQRKEYEKQFKQLKYLMSPTAAMEQPFQPFSPTDVAKHRPSLGGTNGGFARINSTEDSFKMGLSKLREDIVRANGMVREANLLAEEVGNPTRFSVTLQIPSHNLTPNRKRGSFVSEAAILVKRRQKNGAEMESQVWSLERLDHKLVDMREVYEEVNGNDKSEGMATVVDPFFEEKENHTFIGVANIFLDILLHDVKLCYQTPIISQQGEVAGRLQIEIERTGGLFPQDRLGHCETNSECSEASSGSLGSEDSESAPVITCKLAIKGATGISPSFSQFVFCQYQFWGEVEVTTVTPVLQNSPQANIFFNHTRDVLLPVSEEFLDYCTEGALSIEVFGLKSTPDDKTFKLGPGQWVQESQGAQARSLADRWLELTRKLELRLDIQELNEAGEYTPVEVLPRDDVGAGGVMQLRQGQQRRVCVTVRPVTSSGMLPLICDAITSIEIGSPCIRSKLQKPLDSYQEEDLNRLRDCWSEALARRREYLDSQIQNFLKKTDKNESEKEREQSLVEQWVNLTEERNAVLAPTENSGVPGAPTPGDKIPEPGMELHSPVLFLSLNSSEFNEESASPCFDDDVPLHGNNSILPKEHGGRFFSLPIIRYLNQDLGAVASWDSSIHDSVYLNRITDCNERAYLIVKVVVRLSHPTVMDLVLRKRVCINIFKRQSLTDKIRRRMGHSSSVESVAVIYEVVSSVPTASQELEDRTSLAAAAASGQEVQPCGVSTGETFIEKYTRGAAAVDEILRLDRLRQNVAIKEILACRMKESNPIQSMRKTLSVPNIRNVMRGSLSLDNISQRALQQLRPQESFQELNLELSSANNGTQVENNHSFDEECKSGGSGNCGSNIAGWRRLPMSMTMSTLHEERIIRQDIDFSSPLAPGQETGNQGSCNNSPGGNEQIVEVNGMTSSLLKSQTTESLSELQMKTETPSLVSSGYESQALSSTTISSNEDSLSIRSMSVEESTECGPEVGDGEPNFRLDMRDMESSNVSQHSSGTEEEKESITPNSLSVTFPEWLVEGESVQVRPTNHSGIVRFLGPTSFASGPWVGVELDSPQGKNDGSVEGVRYFSCGTKRGMFVRPKNLRLDKRGRDLRITRKSQQ